MAIDKKLDKEDAEHAVFCGQCIEVVYKMYFNDPDNPTPTPSWALPKGYKFVAWVLMKDFTPFGPGPYKFYGLIASSPSDSNWVLAIRGTEDLTEWLDDLTSIVLTPMPNFGQVGDGFYKIYQTLRVVRPSPPGALGVESLQPTGSFAQQVRAAIRDYSRQAESPQIEVTGHSLGAALATLYVADNSTNSNARIPLICTFASPRVGDEVFASMFDNLGITSWRIVNDPDLVPKLPIVGFQHVQTEYLYNSGWSTVWSLSCWHALETYLHLLDSSQPLQPQCIWPPPTATAPSRVPAAAPLLAPTEREIALPHEGRVRTRTRKEKDKV
jgi:hypothetical protein